MLKILYIGNFELPNKNAAAQRVCGNAKAMKQAGAEVVLVGVSKERVNSEILETKCEVEGFVAFERNYPSGLTEWVHYSRDIAPYLSIISQLGGVDIIICYNFFSTAIQRLKDYSNRNNIKCVADVTEWYIMKQRKFPNNIFRGIETSYRMRMIQKKLDGLIVISRYLYEYYQKCENVIILPPLVDCEDEKWINNNSKNKDIINLVYAGSPGKKDELGLIIDAVMSTKRKVTLDIIGIEEDTFKKDNHKYLKCTMKDYGICFHGRIDHISTLEYIKKANYSCFFRKSNRMTNAGFPTKFVEAISCGTPVITNRTSNICDYIDEANARNGFFVEDIKVKSIESKIENLPYYTEVTSKVFDYRNYVDGVKKWLNDVLKEN